MTAEYNRHGIQFLYPENWVLADEQLDGAPRSVSVQSPSSAFWSVDIHPFSADQDAILGQTLDTMREEYEELEVVEVQEQICGEDAHGLDLMFWCLDFAVACRIRFFRHGHATFVLTYQAEDREFEDLKAVFAAISTSLLSEPPIRAGASMR